MNEPQHYVLNAETGYLELKLTQPEDREEPPKDAKVEESDDAVAQDA